MSEVRVRRHTDGRVALHIQDDDYYRWSSWKLNDRYIEHKLLADEDVSGEGWSELLVAELPEPDGHIEMDDAPYWAAGDDTLPSWVAYEDGVEIETGEVVPAGELRVDALKMLAAAIASEQHRKEDTAQ